MKNLKNNCPKNPYKCKMREICEQFRNGLCPYTIFNGKNQFSNANSIINVFNEFQEIIIYNKTFLVPNENTQINLEIDRSRLFEKLPNGVLLPLKDDITIEKVQRTIFNSYKRSCDNLYGYLLANKWDYFFTLTFSPKLVDRNDDNAVKNLWSKFEKNFTRRKDFKNVKIICVPERHEPNEEFPKGALHFHCLFGDCNLDKYLTKAKYPDNSFNRKLKRVGKQIYNKNGQLIYNCSLWKFGFNTVCKIETNEPQEKVVNYIAKYVNKQNKIGYCCKRFYHTRNLNFKNKFVELLNEDFINSIKNNAQLYKSNDRFSVFRIYKN